MLLLALLFLDFYFLRINGLNVTTAAASESAAGDR
jgi:hypothetical protein